jgi:hypothetical protein
MHPGEQAETEPSCQVTLHLSFSLQQAVLPGKAFMIAVSKTGLRMKVWVLLMLHKE